MTATCTYGHTERTAWCKSCRTTFPGCKIDGCTEPHYGRGFCHLHAEQDRRLNGSPNGGGRWARGSRPTTCQDDTCSNPHYARGLCTLHYKREERARKAAERAPCSHPHRANHRPHRNYPPDGTRAHPNQPPHDAATSSPTPRKPS